MAGLAALLVVLAGTVVMSMVIGSRGLAAAEIWRYLLSPIAGDPTSTVVWESRVPRTLIALIAGMALGVSGGLMQAVTRNPMTDPGILGVNAGAAFCVVLAMAVFGISTIQGYLWFAFAGAFAAAVIVFLVGNSGPARGNPIRMTLAGVALGAILSGFTSALLLLNSDIFARMRGWSAGTTASRGLDSVLPIVPFAALGLLLALLSTRALNVLALGEASAVAMGARPNRIRALALLTITLLAGSATAVAGPIAFIGLLAAHLARWIVGPHQGWIMAYALVGAPAILILSDVLGRVIVPGEAPVGIVTAFVGAPLLIVLVRRHRISEA